MQSRCLKLLRPKQEAPKPLGSYLKARLQPALAKKKEGQILCSPHRICCMHPSCCVQVLLLCFVETKTENMPRTVRTSCLRRSGRGLDNRRITPQNPPMPVNIEMICRGHVQKAWPCTHVTPTKGHAPVQIKSPQSTTSTILANRGTPPQPILPPKSQIPKIPNIFFQIPKIYFSKIPNSHNIFFQNPKFPKYIFQNPKI